MRRPQARPRPSDDTQPASTLKRPRRAFGPGRGVLRETASMRRQLLLFVILAVPACRPRVVERPGSRIDHSLAAATRALVVAQSPDGAWRSHTYGGMKD